MSVATKFLLKSSLLYSLLMVTYLGFAKTFVNMPENVNLSEFNTVIIWCETFGEFITSAQFR